MVPNLKSRLSKREAPAVETATEAATVAPTAVEMEVTGTTPLSTHVFGHKHHKLTTMKPDAEDAISSTTPPKGEMTKVTEQAVQIAHDMGIPTWGLVAIVILVLAIVLGIVGFCIRRCCKKRRSKDGKKGMKGVDLKSVQLLGSAYKEKVSARPPVASRCLSVCRVLLTHSILVVHSSTHLHRPPSFNRLAPLRSVPGAARHGGVDRERRGARRGREQTERTEAGQAQVQGASAHPPVTLDWHVI